jgi:hypothetical protein
VNFLKKENLFCSLLECTQRHSLPLAASILMHMSPPQTGARLWRWRCGNGESPRSRSRRPIHDLGEMWRVFIRIGKRWASHCRVCKKAIPSIYFPENKTKQNKPNSKKKAIQRQTTDLKGSLF